MNPLLLLAALAASGLFGEPQPVKPKVFSMIRAFNAFQMVVLFAAMPHIIGWLHTEPFAYSTGAFWVACAAYVVMFGGGCVCVYDEVGK